MRIIGGAFRGRRLADPGKGDANAHLRPTSDRVRESLFNILATRGAIAGAHVLDLFAGTGALGLEALSRGAAHVTFVENGAVALGLLRQNIALCKAEAKTQVIARDARHPGAGTGCETGHETGHDLVFLDPPYGKGLGEAALAAALAGGWIAPGATVVWEESAPVVPPAGLRLRDERRYGDTVVRIFTSGECGPARPRVGET